MKANISNELIARVAKINGKPIIRGMDKAITECLNKLEDGTCADTNEKKEELENKIVTTDKKTQVDFLNDGCKKELVQDA